MPLFVLMIENMMSRLERGARCRLICAENRNQLRANGSYIFLGKHRRESLDSKVGEISLKASARLARETCESQPVLDEDLF